jgi:hypothetical protein
MHAFSSSAIHASRFKTILRKWTQSIQALLQGDRPNSLLFKSSRSNRSQNALLCVKNNAYPPFYEPAFFMIDVFKRFVLPLQTLTLQRVLLALLGAALCAQFATAQTPTVNWQHRAESFGDGTRSYVLRPRGPYVIVDPGISERHIVPTANGAFVIIPTNTASGSDHLKLLYTPYLFGTRGYQVLKLDAQGNLLWKRFVALADESSRAIDSQTSNDGLFLSTNTLQDARATANGGLALLVSGAYVTFNALGQQLLYSINHCDNDLDFLIDQRALNVDGILVAWSSASDTATLRVCAIDVDGQELERVAYSGVQGLNVADYQRNIGFLARTWILNAGVFSNPTLSLRNGQTTRWSKTGAMALEFDGAMSSGRYLRATGEVWAYFADQLIKLSTNGTILWQQTPLERYTLQYWLNDGGVLMRADGLRRWRAFNADGSTRWVHDLPESYAAASQLTATHLRTVQLSNAIEPIAINIASGAIQATSLAYEDEGTLMGLGLVGQDNFVQLRYGTTVQSRSSNVGCFLPGLSGDCVRNMYFAKPEAKTQSALSGLTLSTLNSLEFPLPTFTLEKSSNVELTGNDDGVTRLFAKHLVHDGIRSQLQIQRLNPNGKVRWTRTLSTPEYDAGNAFFRQFPNLLIAGATEYAPQFATSTPKLWGLAERDGSVLWELTLPAALQRMRKVPKTTVFNAFHLPVS